MLDQSIVSRLPKSSSVSGLSVIHRNINNRMPSSKTNHQIYPPPPPNPPISARTTNENDRKITLSGSTSEMLRCLATFVNTRYDNGMRVVGKGSWKEHRSWKVLSWKEPSGVGKNRAKLERFQRSWKEPSEIGKNPPKLESFF